MAENNDIWYILTFPVDGSTDVHKRISSSIYFERRGIFKLENSIIKLSVNMNYGELKNYSNWYI